MYWKKSKACIELKKNKKQKPPNQAKNPKKGKKGKKKPQKNPKIYSYLKVMWIFFFMFKSLGLERKHTL